MKGQAESGEMDMATGEVPRTLDEARDPEWLASALTPVSGGAAIRSVEVLEVIRTMATKVRFAVDFDGADGPPPSLLPQGFSGCRCGVGRGRRDHGAGSGFLPADRAPDFRANPDLRKHDCRPRRTAGHRHHAGPDRRWRALLHRAGGVHPRPGGAEPRTDCQAQCPAIAA